jgi:hypothetical protein
LLKLEETLIVNTPSCRCLKWAIRHGRRRANRISQIDLSSDVAVYVGVRYYVRYGCHASNLLAIEARVSFPLVLQCITECFIIVNSLSFGSIVDRLVSKIERRPRTEEHTLLTVHKEVVTYYYTN